MRWHARLDQVERQLESKLGSRFRWDTKMSMTLAWMESSFLPAPDDDVDVWKRQVTDKVKAIAKGWGGPEVTVDDLCLIFAERLKDITLPSC